MSKGYTLTKDPHGGYLLTVGNRQAIVFRIDRRSGWGAFERDEDGNQIDSTVYDYRRDLLIQQMVRDLSTPRSDDVEAWQYHWKSRNPAPSRTFTPPQSVADEARMGLALRAEVPPSQRCCTPVGLRRAVQLMNRQPVSVRTLKRMRSYFARHAVDARGKGWREASRGWQAWLMWGGDAGRVWCNKVLDSLGE